MGLFLEAWRAGYMPKTRPISTELPIPTKEGRIGNENETLVAIYVPMAIVASTERKEPFAHGVKYIVRQRNDYH